MHLLQKALSSLLLILVLFVQNGNFLFAEESVVVNSLDMLPSTHQETVIQDHEESVGEQVPTFSKEVPIPTESYSLLAAQSEYIQSLPTLTPVLRTSPIAIEERDFSVQDIENHSIQSFFGEFHPVAQTDFRFPAGKTKQFRVEKTARMQKSDQGVFQKMPIDVEIPTETLLANPDGKTIDPQDVGIFEAEVSVKEKADIYHTKKQRKTPKNAKPSLSSAQTVFEFGIPGVHLTFSKPVKITLKTPNMSDGVAMDIGVLHAGESAFNTSGLSLWPDTLCDAGVASLPGSQAVVKNGKVTFYTCGASSFTMNPTGGTTGSNDLRAVIGDCGQIQLYYNNLTQIYTGNPPATGCSVGGTMDAWPVLRIGTVTYGNDFTAWTSSTTTGTTLGNTYTATSTMTITTGGRTYQLIIDWSHTAPNKYITWSWRVVVPAGNTLPIKFYYGMDSFVAGGDANDVGYLSNTGGLTFGVYDATANVLSAFRYMSGASWTAYEAGPLATVRGKLAGGTNFANTITASTDLGFGVNWDFGTPAVATTYSGTLEWRLAPYVAANVPDLIPGIGQPEGPLTTGFVSQMPITVSNIGNLASTGVHTAVLTIPTNITGPASAFTDNGWSCGAQVGTTVTCTKTTTIAPLVDEVFRIPVTPQPAAGGTSATFNLSISNPSDSNTGNNTAFASIPVVAGAPTIAPGGVTGARFWSKADGGKNCTTTGCTITTWFNSGTVAINAVTGLGTVTYDPATQINYNPTLYFNNASLNINNNLALPTLANSIFVVSRIGAGGNFYIGTQTVTNNARSWRTSPTTDQWMRYNSTVFYNGANNRAANVPAITSTVRQAAGASAGYTNGRSLLTSASNLAFTVNNLGIGRDANTNSTLSNVAEVVIYNTALTTADQNRVESYLALKYGITLDQTVAKNYILANSSVAWNASLATTYNRDIAGIARDDLASLSQLRSQSINNTGDIIVARDGATIGSNSRSLIWANDGTATGTFSTTDAPAGYQRIAREWQFQEKLGDVGNIKISYPVTSLPGGAVSPIYMLVDSDGTFAAGARAYTGTLVGANWEWTINMTDMSILTFAQKGDITAPLFLTNSISSGTLIPHGNFNLTLGYTDTGSSIVSSSFTGQIYGWDSTGSVWQTANLAPTYMSILSASSSTGVLQVASIPFGKYRFDISVADSAGNTKTESFTYFVDKVEWTISSDTYDVGNLNNTIQTFGTGELAITIKTVGAGFDLTLSPNMTLTSGTNTINYWNGTFGWGYDLWNGVLYSGNITSHATSVTLTSIAKNIHPQGQQNTFVYRVKYGINADMMQPAGDYLGKVNFGLLLHY